ncbi:MAG: hypothetical protein FD167_3590 [bacterium]|nr:MAG: hypothetical protein FD167_3590 [bacterium]
MQTTIKSIFSTIVILIALYTGAFAQDKANPINSPQSNQTQTTKFRAEYLPANIEKAQQILKAKGLYKGETTGTIDSTTKNAIKAYQQEVGLNPTGHLNKDTRQKLGIETPSNPEKALSSKNAKKINNASETK